MTSPTDPISLALRAAVVEVERHAGQAGWNRPARLYALVRTTELAAAEPGLAEQLGVDDGTADLLTPIQQELDDPSESLEDLLGRIAWPESVEGSVAVVERLVLPPEVEPHVPDDPAAATEFAAGHAAREDVRIAVGVLRSGEAHCVVRLRSHDSDDSLLHGEDLVPGLVRALRETLEE